MVGSYFIKLIGVPRIELGLHAPHACVLPIYYTPIYKIYYDIFPAKIPLKKILQPHINFLPSFSGEVGEAMGFVAGS